METEIIKTLIEQADSDLKRAKGELYQPAEDVVNYCVCVSARSALQRYLLSLYLTLKKDEMEAIEVNQTIEELVRLCSKEVSELKSLNFDHINCKEYDVLNTDEIFFCNDVGIVNHCTDLADKVRKILFFKLPEGIIPGLSSA